MNKINILDCTLRDGGYVNNWEFNNDSIKNILNALTRSEIEIIECGFISQKKGKEKDSSIFNSIETINRLINQIDLASNTALFCVMINCGEYDINDLPVFDPEIHSIKGIRLAFHKNQIQEAYLQSKQIIERGYSLFVQPMVTLSFSDMEIINMLNNFNKLDIYAMYIVDSFGSMFGSDFRRLHYIFENNLRKDVILGYHSHNNLQLAYSNAIDFINIKDINRHIAIDSSIHGMGRGAGNLNTELFADYLNKKISANYSIEPLLEVIDEYLEFIYKEKYWGYSIAHFLSASENCHPNYSSFLVNKKNLTILDIKKILARIPEDKKQNYTEEYITDIYIEYKSEQKTKVKQIEDIFANKEIIVIASGINASYAKNSIEEFRAKPNSIVISVNHIPSFCSPDFLFFSNQKRFDKFINSTTSIPLILTTNISISESIKPYSVFDYHQLVEMTSTKSDNVAILLLNLLIMMNIKHVTIAGLDGYKNDSKNYSYEEYDRIINLDEIERSNKSIASAISEIKKMIDIHFLTESIFDKKD